MSLRSGSLIVFATLLAACGKPSDVPVPSPAEPPVKDNASDAPPVVPSAPPASQAPTGNAPAPADVMPAAAPVATPPAPAPAAPDVEQRAPVEGATAVAGSGGDVIKGWKTWRSAACERCHGPAQEGMVGPSLIESLKTLSKEEVRKTVIEGRLERGMPGHPYLADKFDDLYAYLKGRSDGSIPTVRPDGA
ncbi:c-type cytochrome [Methyloversatilis thermotolerans]|uniref:c-type cytochrome n=1 Tax=Methyloversatilis thermotolerans TaxID=1346290 RepID=UPI00037D9E75|nr:cytochrome c [Methyloversatilis thermotolerans]